MQVFSLVNALLKRDARTQRRDHSIERYAVRAYDRCTIRLIHEQVVPLSANSGLIGWVVRSVGTSFLLS